uniref:Uncharacterized protein n=1 Tax=Anguilla anguilla TaxID=7936 RepID=A0A0E9QGE6_ANGAN
MLGGNPGTFQSGVSSTTACVKCRPLIAKETNTNNTT